MSSPDSYSPGASFWFSLLSLGSGLYSLGTFVAFRRSRSALDAIESSSLRSIAAIRQELESRAQQFRRSEGSNEKSVPTLSLYSELCGETANSVKQVSAISSAHGESVVLLRKCVYEVKEVFKQSERIIKEKDQEMREVTWNREVVETKISEESNENRSLWIRQIDQQPQQAQAQEGVQQPQREEKNIIRVDPELISSSSDLWRKVKEDYVPLPNIRPSLNVEIQLVFGNNTNNNGLRVKEPQVIGHKYVEYVIPESERIYALAWVRYDPSTGELVLSEHGVDASQEPGDNAKPRPVLLEYGSPNEVRYRYERSVSRWKNHAIVSGAIAAAGIAAALAMWK